MPVDPKDLSLAKGYTSFNGTCANLDFFTKDYSTFGSFTSNIYTFEFSFAASTTNFSPCKFFELEGASQFAISLGNGVISFNGVDLPTVDSKVNHFVVSFNGTHTHVFFNGATFGPVSLSLPSQINGFQFNNCP